VNAPPALGKPPRGPLCYPFSTHPRTLGAWNQPLRTNTHRPCVERTETMTLPWWGELKKIFPG